MPNRFIGILFVVVGMGVGFFSLKSRAQNPTNDPIQNNTTNPINNPAPGNPASYPPPAMDPDSAPPTSATIHIPDSNPGPGSGSSQAASGLTERIRQEIITRDARFAKTVSVTEKGGTVILRGQVPTAADRKTIDRVARAYAGKKKVQNEIISSQ